MLLTAISLIHYLGELTGICARLQEFDTKYFFVLQNQQYETIFLVTFQTLICEDSREF